MSVYNTVSLPKLFGFFVKIQGKTVDARLFDTSALDFQLENLEREQKENNNSQNDISNKLQKIKEKQIISHERKRIYHDRTIRVIDCLLQLSEAGLQKTLDLYLADFPRFRESKFSSFHRFTLENMKITSESFKALSIISSGPVSFDTEQGLENLMTCVSSILDIKATTDVAWEKTKKYEDLIQDQVKKALFKKYIRDLAHVEWTYGLEKDRFLERAMADVIEEEPDEKITDEKKQERLLYFIEVMEHMRHSKTNPYDLASLKRLVEGRLLLDKNFDSICRRLAEDRISPREIYPSYFLLSGRMSETVKIKFGHPKEDIEKEMRTNEENENKKNRWLFIGGLAMIGLSFILDSVTPLVIDPSHLVFFTAFYLLLVVIGTCMMIIPTLLSDYNRHQPSYVQEQNEKKKEQEKRLRNTKKEIWEACFLEKVPEDQKELTKEAIQFVLKEQNFDSSSDPQGIFLDNLADTLQGWSKDGQFAPERIHEFNSIVFHLKSLKELKDTAGYKQAWTVYYKQVVARRLDVSEVIMSRRYCTDTKQKMLQWGVERPKPPVSRTVGLRAITQEVDQKSGPRFLDALDLETTELVARMYCRETEKKRSDRLHQRMYDNETLIKKSKRAGHFKCVIKKPERVKLY